jgi:hypothetical protein
MRVGAVEMAGDAAVTAATVATVARWAAWVVARGAAREGLETAGAATARAVAARLAGWVGMPSNKSCSAKRCR